MPISRNENYNFSYDPARGATLGFSKLRQDPKSYVGSAQNIPQKPRGKVMLESVIEMLWEYWPKKG